MFDRITSFFVAVLTTLGIGTRQYVSPSEPFSVENTSRSAATYMVNYDGVLNVVVYEDGTVLELQGENDADELAALRVETNAVPQATPEPVESVEIDPDIPDTETVYNSIDAIGDAAETPQSATMTVTYTVPTYYTIPAN